MGVIKMAYGFEVLVSSDYDDSAELEAVQEVEEAEED